MTQALGQALLREGQADRVGSTDELNRWISETLELAVSPGEFQADVISNQEPAQILNAARLHLRRLMQFQTVAFLMVNESDFDFLLTECEPEADRCLLQQELEHQIANGIFAWAIHQNRMVTIASKYFDHPVLLHPLVTRSRVIGMFAGILAVDELSLTNIFSNLLTLLLSNLAHALENALLYKRINDQNRNLEETIQSRTQELRKALEEANVATIAKNQFLANISHEIRTPLNAIIGFTDMLLETSLDADQREYGRTIKDSGETLLVLINDILDFSKAEAKQIDLERNDFNLREAVYDVCDMIRPRVNKKPIEILCRTERGLPSWVRGDRHRFQQVLLNMMGNAAKFTDAGEIEVSLALEKEQDHQLKLHTVIRDTGIGIPKDKLTAIFKPFQQADGSTTRKYGGTGLGLSICKMIAEAMKGDVWAESNIGEGSRFHFSAWVDRSEGQHEDEGKPCSLLHEKILLVDDNLTHLEILKDDLQSLGVRVITLTSRERVVSTLKEALKMGDPFTFCFIDTQIPFEGGGDAAREIRQSEIPNLLLIALSSTLEPHLQGWERDVYDDFLIKPVRKEKIYQILGKLRGGRKKEKQRGKNLEEFRAAGGGGRQEDNGSLHLLVVEDNLVNQKLATKILEKFGCRVDVASNGVEALEKVKRIPYDLVFMDCHMTEMDGYDATIEIRRREGASRHTPIVAMTANSIKGDRERCIEVGMDDYISKPIKKEMVYEMVKKWCQG